MNNWQNHVADKMSAFIGEDFEYAENEVRMDINQREAYVILKALEFQELHSRPLLVMEDSLVEEKK